MKFVRRVLIMNKLTKQLLSLGLSVVTVAGMVLPVFAEEVDETLENITPISKFQMKPMRMSGLH